MNGNLLGRPTPPGGLDGPEPSEAALEYRHHVEADLLAKINSTLEPLLGANKFRANVSVECDFSGGEQSEEIFDPARSVMSSSQRTEDSAAAPPRAAFRAPLPRCRARPHGRLRCQRASSRTTENIAYQTSRTVQKDPYAGRRDRKRCRWPCWWINRHLGEGRQPDAPRAGAAPA